MTADHEDICPLCRSERTRPYTADTIRQYRICGRCELVYVPKPYHLAPMVEKARYDLHENHPDDPGYRTFLNRLFAPLCRHLPEGAAGLDFGCGPGPALAAMLREQGYEVDIYDKFYAPDPGIFDKTYDFIAAAEVLEHLRNPGDELERLWEVLRPGGMLGAMTKRVYNRQAFEKWHYKNDDTHVCFFSRATFRWLADQWQAAVAFADKDVVLFHKPVQSR